MAIYVVDGRPRHGKTAYVMNMMPYFLKDASKYGLKVFSNVYCKVENIRFIRKNYKKPEQCVGDLSKKKDREDPKKLLYYWRNINEWEYMKKGVIICDEATRYFNARRWQMLSDETEIKLQQHGKDKLDIWAITQHWTRLDQSLRVLVEEFFRVERVIGWGNTTLVSKASVHTLENLERWERNPEAFEKAKEGEEEGGKAVEYEHFFPYPLFHKPYYDSNQQVGRSSVMPFKHIERVCEHKGCKLHRKPKIIHV